MTTTASTHYLQPCASAPPPTRYEVESESTFHHVAYSDHEPRRGKTAPECRQPVSPSPPVSRDAPPQRGPAGPSYQARAQKSPQSHDSVQRTHLLPAAYRAKYTYRSSQSPNKPQVHCSIPADHAPGKTPELGSLHILYNWYHLEQGARQHNLEGSHIP